MRKICDRVGGAPRDATAARHHLGDCCGLVGAQQLDEAAQRTGRRNSSLVLWLDCEQSQDKAGLLLDVVKAVVWVGGGEGSSWPQPGKHLHQAKLSSR